MSILRDLYVERGPCRNLNAKQTFVIGAAYRHAKQGKQDEYVWDRWIECESYALVTATCRLDALEEYLTKRRDLAIGSYNDWSYSEKPGGFGSGQRVWTVTMFDDYPHGDSGAARREDAELVNIGGVTVRWLPRY